jgi:hypothetical protein
MLEFNYGYTCNGLLLSWLTGERKLAEGKTGCCIRIKTSNVLYRNFEAHSCNHYCSGNPIIITYSDGLFADLGTEHAKRMPGFAVFFHIIS